MIACAMLVMGAFALLARRAPEPTPPSLGVVEGAETRMDAAQEEMRHTITQEALLKESNAMREQNGMELLHAREELTAAASAKCADMVERNYWSHDDPAGNKPWRFIDAAGYTYETAGENLASGYSTSTSVVDGWMRSSEHRENLLSKDFSEVGFGICESSNFVGRGPRVIVVQHLARPSKDNEARSVQSQAGYSRAECVRKPIPRKTVRIEVDYLYEGDSWTSEGWDGYTETCTASSTGYRPEPVSMQPYDTKVFVGTKQRTPSPAETETTTE